ncbi:MAG: peptidylprolyl isomerase [Geobacter sp.]|nr:MAG: peptidylprolyl isomerase [Geobacter sp.]
MDFRMRPIAAAAIFMAIAGCSRSPQYELSREVPVLVNGAPISRVEVDRAAKAFLAQQGVAQPATPEVMKKAEAAACEQLITAELLYQEGCKLPVKDIDSRVAQTVAQSRSRYRSDEEFNQALKSVDMTRKEVEAAVRKDIIIGNLAQARCANAIQVSAAEITRFYEVNKDKFRLRERVRASQILVKVSEQAAPEVREQARAKAVALLRRVRGGEDFTALARVESAPPTNRNGGDLGVLNRGEAPPAFERAAFALKPGEVSEVVETPLGFHIVKLVQKLPPSVTSLDEEKARIAAYLKQDKMRRAVAELAGKLRTGARIEKL